jgi:ATP-dependent DNA helicase RecG
VDIPQRPDYSELGERVVQDKQDFVDNVLQLMEASLGYLLRNIQVGVSPRDAGTSQPQYPVSLLRETVNNALAHRDYAIDRQVILAIKPGKHIAIQNPGTFRSQLLIQAPNHEIPLYRILPEAKPRNPKLADVLRVFRKWEGRGIGMATLVNLCLQNVMDVPYYRLLTEEVRLHVCAGQLLDERMERHFQSLDGYVEKKLGGGALTKSQLLVLSYLIKSEWHNQKLEYTILLTPDNNHFDVIAGLEKAGLITKHPEGRPHYPVYVADRVLIRLEYTAELRAFFGPTFDGLPPFHKQLLGVVYRFGQYSKAKAVSAKQASYVLWYEEGEPGSVEQFDLHYRKVRRAFNKLLDFGYLKRQPSKGGGYLLNDAYTEIKKGRLR